MNMRIEPQDTDSTETFHLPLVGLFADVEAGTGCIRLTDELEDCDIVDQLRIMQDWQRDLRELNRTSLDRLFKAQFATLAVSRREQVERFSEYCFQQGLECPPDLTAVLLESALWGYTSTTQ